MTVFSTKIKTEEIKISIRILMMLSAHTRKRSIQNILKKAGAPLVSNQLSRSSTGHFRVHGLPPLQSESKCEVFVMVISSTLHMNEN